MEDFNCGDLVNFNMLPRDHSCGIFIKNGAAFSMEPLVKKTVCDVMRGDLD